MIKHNCGQLQEIRRHPDTADLDIKIFIMGDNMWKLLLSDNKKFIAMGIAIECCPFCGKELKSGK